MQKFNLGQQKVKHCTTTAVVYYDNLIWHRHMHKAAFVVSR